MVNPLDCLDLFPGRDANECADAWQSPILRQSGLTALFQFEKNVPREVTNQSKEENDEGVWDIGLALTFISDRVLRIVCGPSA
jgi:hypothetical protein